MSTPHKGSEGSGLGCSGSQLTTHEQRGMWWDLLPLAGGRQGAPTGGVAGWMSYDGDAPSGAQVAQVQGTLTHFERPSRREPSAQYVHHGSRLGHAEFQLPRWVSSSARARAPNLAFPPFEMDAGVLSRASNGRCYSRSPSHARRKQDEIPTLLMQWRTHLCVLRFIYQRGVTQHVRDDDADAIRRPTEQERCTFAHRAC